MTSSALTYFDKLWNVTQTVFEACEEVVFHARIAHQTVQIVCAGEALATMLTNSLSHLRTEDSSPALTIYAWDSASTGVPAPNPPWEPEAHQAHGRIEGYNTERIRTANLPPNDGFNMLDLDRRIGLHWNASVDALNLHERSFPLRVILNWWAAEQGLSFAHAAAVGYPDGGVLIVGKGGMGKSTTALACLRSDLRYASDDHVLLRGAPAPYVYGLYHSAKLHPRQLERLPFLAPHVANSHEIVDDKALFFVQEAFPEAVATGFPLKAILVPRVNRRSIQRKKHQTNIQGPNDG